VNPVNPGAEEASCGTLSVFLGCNLVMCVGAVVGASARGWRVDLSASNLHCWSGPLHDRSDLKVSAWAPAHALQNGAATAHRTSHLQQVIWCWKPTSNVGHQVLYEDVLLHSVTYFISGASPLWNAPLPKHCVNPRQDLSLNWVDGIYYRTCHASKRNSRYLMGIIGRG